VERRVVLHAVEDQVERRAVAAVEVAQGAAQR
jgi:hypothetical protein